ncbi:MAG: hypothetical protein M9887_01015 [Chitinophagales bacterium]|nr:hypothetical protein [Chitinophagales bacterium]
MEEQKKIFIEKIGVKTENHGHSPLAGRIIGTLLLADPSYMTFEELCDYLSASKSSISTNLKLLMSESIAMVEYFTLPGDRKRYFRISVQGWQSHLDKIPDEFEYGNQLLTDIIQYRIENHLDENFTKELKEIVSFYRFIIAKLPLLKEEWEQLKLKNNI